MPNYIFYKKILYVIYQHFSYKFQISDLLWFLSWFFESVKELHKVQFPILINITNPHLLFVDQHAKKTHANIYQQSKQNYNHQLCILLNIQFFIALSTSQHKDRRPIAKVDCYIVILWWSWLIVCTKSPFKNANCF